MTQQELNDAFDKVLERLEKERQELDAFIEYLRKNKEALLKDGW